MPFYSDHSVLKFIFCVLLTNVLVGQLFVEAHNKDKKQNIQNTSHQLCTLQFCA